MSTKGDRIRQVRQKLQLTQEQFAAFLGGVSRGAVGNWERNQGIKEDNLELIAHKTGVSFEWLATNRGSMDPNGIVEPPVESDAYRLVRIPDLNIFGGLGGGGVMEIITDTEGRITDAEQLRGYWTFPEYMVRAFKSLKGIYAWEVRGDSMEPTLPGGSVVFVDMEQSRPPPDDIYAIDYGEGLMVKRIKLIPRTKRLSVISDNQRYPADELPREEVRIYGRVIGWFQWRG